MNFGNNIERLLFLQSPAALVEISPDGNTIYKGYTRNRNATAFSKDWMILRIETMLGKEGVAKTIITECAEGGFENAWNDKEKLKYRYI